MTKKALLLTAALVGALLIGVWSTQSHTTNSTTTSKVQRAAETPAPAERKHQSEPATVRTTSQNRPTPTGGVDDKEQFQRLVAIKPLQQQAGESDSHFKERLEDTRRWAEFRIDAKMTPEQELALTVALRDVAVNAKTVHDDLIRAYATGSKPEQPYSEVFGEIDEQLQREVALVLDKRQQRLFNDYWSGPAFYAQVSPFVPLD